MGALDSVKGKIFLGETFPVYTPNLGPNFFAAVHGAELEFGEITTWCEPVVNDYSDIEKINLPVPNSRMQGVAIELHRYIRKKLYRVCRTVKRAVKYH